jgi:hypothetical protein
MPAHLYGFYISVPPEYHRIYMATGTNVCAAQHVGHVRLSLAEPRSIAMLDVVYILIGAAFLGGCVLYAFACDRL